MIIWIVLATLVLVLITFIVIRKLNKGNKGPDYYTLFIVGITWIAIGIPLKNYALSGMGVIFMAVGMANKKKWNKNRMRWSDLTERQKKFKLIILVVLGILLLLGLIFFLLAN